ncbi:MAG: acetyl-CoA acetyltransferase [Saprospiraceae bacterium]|nr:MAG: acetyl-CoA acetyltransferase [Saprospiraceae bacterium]
MTEAYIFDALRTPRGKGKRGGALYEVKPIDLLATALKALQSRNDLATNEVDDVVIGCVTPIGDQGSNIAKAALLHADWDHRVGGIQINRYCASGLEAINLAAMKIRSGLEELVVAGGTESMSRVPMGSDGGPLLNEPELINRMNYVPQGISADLIATIEGFTRAQVDAYAFQSQERAHHAQQQGYFQKALTPIYDRNGLVVLAEDEYPRLGTTVEALATLSPAFAQIGMMGSDQMALHRYPMLERINHVHTAGNSSGIVDGAALVLLGSKEKGKALGLKPRGRIVAIGNVSVEPTIMLTGPAPASRKALERAGMKASDIDLWECNEAFASVVLKFQREMGIDETQLNVNGGAIALGHPLGATGAMLLGTLLDELERRDLKTGLVTLCAGGGMGVATIIERV